MRVNTQDMAVGEIRAVSNGVIVVKTGCGLKAFSRYCSHEGADLSLGYVRDGCLKCPWHNLPFKLENGEQPCQSLKNLKEYQVEDLGNGEYEIGGISPSDSA